MADYLSLETYAQFLASAKSLSEGTTAIICSSRKFHSKGLDLDSYHRHHRICAKHGLLNAVPRFGDIDYTLTPKGMAIYDQYVIYRANKNKL